MVYSQLPLNLIALLKFASHFCHLGNDWEGLLKNERVLEKRTRTRTRFETEVKGNSEIAYFAGCYPTPPPQVLYLDDFEIIKLTT